MMPKRFCTRPSKIDVTSFNKKNTIYFQALSLLQIYKENILSQPIFIDLFSKTWVHLVFSYGTRVAPLLVVTELACTIPKYVSYVKMDEKTGDEKWLWRSVNDAGSTNPGCPARPVRLATCHPSRQKLLDFLLLAVTAAGLQVCGRREGEECSSGGHKFRGLRIRIHSKVQAAQQIVRWGFCTILFSLLPRFKNRSLLCWVRGEKFLWVPAVWAGFPLMERKKKACLIRTCFHLKCWVLGAPISLNWRAPLVWNLRLLPTYVGTSVCTEYNHNDAFRSR